MGSFDQLINTLRTIIATIEIERTTTAKAIELLADAKTAFGHISHGSNRPEATQVTQRYSQALEAIHEALGALTNSASQISQYMGHLGSGSPETVGQPTDSITGNSDTNATTSKTSDPVENVVERDSRGRVVPPGVRRLPSGRYPQNFEYAGRTYNGRLWTEKLAAKYPDGVRFTDDGFPDFSPYAIATVIFESNFVGDYSIDPARANQESGLAREPEGFTWHHHQDKKTMHLIPKELHQAVRHAGGASLMKGMK